MSTHPDIKPKTAIPQVPVPTTGGIGQSPFRSKRTLKRLFVALIGGTVVLIGIAMIVLPGPALIVIPAGLAILATEFIWARRALEKCRTVADQVRKLPWFKRIWRRKNSNSAAAHRMNSTDTT
jgi:hypothetical protein